MDSTFLGQGSYGCVYKQKLRCTKHDSNIPLKAIKDNKKIRTFDIEKMWGLGTPEDLNVFLMK